MAAVKALARSAYAAFKFDSEWEEADLGAHDIQPESGARLGAVLSVPSSLVRLHLKVNKLGDAGVASIARALRVNRSLLVLDVGANHLTDHGARVLSEMLRYNKALTRLDLARNPEVGVEGAAALADAVCDNKALLTLTLHHCPLPCGALKGAKLAGAPAPPKAIDLSGYLLSVQDGAFAGRLLADNGVADVCRLTGTPLPLARLKGRAAAATEAAAAAGAEGKAGDGGDDDVVCLKRAGIDNVDAMVLGALMAGNEGSVRTLDLRDNGIGAAGCGALGRGLQFNRVVTALWLDGNSALTDAGRDELGVAEVAEALSTNSTLTELSCRDCRIGDRGAAAFARSLPDNTTLRVLDLRDNPIEDRSPGGDALVAAVAAALSLHVLNAIKVDRDPPTGARRNARARGTSAYRAPGAKPHAGAKKPLPELPPPLFADLAQHQSDGFQVYEAAFIAAQLRVTECLTALDLSRNGLGAPHLAALAAALPACDSLRDLCLAHNALCSLTTDRDGELSGKFDGKGVSALAKALMPALKCKLASLDVRFGAFGDTGRHELEDALSQNRSLTRLNGIELHAEAATADATMKPSGLEPYELAFVGARLAGSAAMRALSVAGNGIGIGGTTPAAAAAPTERGVARLAASLRLNAQLTVLDVSRNRLGPGGALALFAALGAHPALVQVVAADNGICTELTKGKGAEASAKLVDAAVHAIGAALRATSTLRLLDFSGNGADGAEIEPITEAAGKCGTLDTLRLARNKLGPRGAAACARMVRASRSLAALDLSKNDLAAIGRPPAAPRGAVSKVDLVCRSMQEQLEIMGGGSFFALFAKYDADGSGQMEFSEFETVLRESLLMGPKILTDADLRAVWKAIDADNSGMITAGEFGGYMSAQAARTKEKDAEADDGAGGGHVAAHGRGDPSGLQALADAVRGSRCLEVLDLTGNRLAEAESYKAPGVRDAVVALADGLHDAVGAVGRVLL